MRRAWCGVFVLCLAGCPKAVPPLATRATPAQVLAALDAQDQKRGPLQGDAKLNVDAPQAHGLVSVFVAAERPAKSHLELMDFFGKPQAIFVTDGAQFGLYQSQENRYLFGKATPQAIANLVPVPLSPEELTAVLLGTLPRVAQDGRWEGEGAQAHLLLEAGGTTERLWLDAAGLLTRAELSGARNLVVTFEAFAAGGRGSGAPLQMPRRIRVEAKDAKATLELKLTQVTYGESLEPQLFVPEAPEGVPAVNLDAPEVGGAGVQP